VRVPGSQYWPRGQSATESHFCKDAWSHEPDSRKTAVSRVPENGMKRIFMGGNLLSAGCGRKSIMEFHWNDETFLGAGSRIPEPDCPDAWKFSCQTVLEQGTNHKLHAFSVRFMNPGNALRLWDFLMFGRWKKNH